MSTADLDESMRRCFPRRRYGYPRRCPSRIGRGRRAAILPEAFLNCSVSCPLAAAETGFSDDSSSKDAACALECVLRLSTTVSCMRLRMERSSASVISGQRRSAMRRGVVASMSISVLMFVFERTTTTATAMTTTTNAPFVSARCYSRPDERATGTGGFSFRRRYVRGASTDGQKEELTVPRWNDAGPWRGASAPSRSCSPPWAPPSPCASSSPPSWRRRRRLGHRRRRRRPSSCRRGVCRSGCPRTPPNVLSVWHHGSEANKAAGLRKARQTILRASALAIRCGFGTHSHIFNEKPPGEQKNKFESKYFCL